MILKDYLAISGEPGLFKFIAQGKNAIIVENLETGKRSSTFNSARVSSLEDISIFTDNEDLSLGKVFDRIFARENGGNAIDSKVGVEELKKYFEAIVPEYSRDKVYISDIRKVVQWYNILQQKNLLVTDEPVAPAKQEVTVEAEEDTVTQKKKKAAPKSKKG